MTPIDQVSTSKLCPFAVSDNTSGAIYRQWFSLTRALNKGCQTKVPNFDIHVRIKEKIAKFEVAVDDLVGVHVVAGTNKLNYEKPSLWLCEYMTMVEHVHESVTRTKLKGHVHILLILEMVCEANDVGMV